MFVEGKYLRGKKGQCFKTGGKKSQYKGSGEWRLSNCFTVANFGHQNRYGDPFIVQATVLHQQPTGRNNKRNDWAVHSL
uniref:Uncharacterized protein n=1 Tax=Anguilla anguilla TaxID=7936 RepID=A0A0E9WT01_ANGAN